MMNTLFLIESKATIYNTKTNRRLLFQRNEGNNVWKKENNEGIVNA